MNPAELKLASGFVYWYLRCNGTLGKVPDIIRSILVTSGLIGSDYHVNLVIQSIRADYDPTFGLESR